MLGRKSCELDNRDPLISNALRAAIQEMAPAGVPLSHRVQLSGIRALRILGIVAKTHDSGVAFLRDGVPELVLEEERFDRVKKTQKFPRRGLIAGLNELGLGIRDIDVMTTPWDVRL
ncbi:MAG TPA: carbamoyltransferase N-terminal domain-containing protein, partial [Hyphomicrobiaceae bacterium]